MRLFAAIPLSVEIKSKLHKLQQSVKGIRRQPAGQMHLTLRFLGETSLETTETIKEQLSHIQVSPFTLMVSGLGTFPKRGASRIIWAVVSNDKPLMQLQSKVEEICLMSGFKTENREYIPHITIGKVKNASSKDVKKWINEHKKWGKEKLFVKEFMLYESQQQAGGVTHEIIETFRLKD